MQQPPVLRCGAMHLPHRPRAVRLSGRSSAGSCPWGLLWQDRCGFPEALQHYMRQAASAGRASGSAPHSRLHRPPISKPTWNFLLWFLFFAEEAPVITVLDTNDASLKTFNGELHKAILLPVLVCLLVTPCCALTMHAEMPKFPGLSSLLRQAGE